MFRNLTIAFVFMLLPQTAHAQEKYTIKLKEVAAGDTWRIEVKETGDSKTTNTIGKEKPKTEENKSSKHLLFTETIIEKPADAKAPTKAKRVYEAAVIKGDGGVLGAKDRVPPYHGKTLLIEKKDKGYEFRIEGGEVLDKDIFELQSEFQGDGPNKPKAAFVPPGPVAVNETWKFDPKLIFGDPGKDPNTQVLNTEGTSKLVKVYKKDGRLYGVVETVVGLEMKMTPPNTTVTMKVTAKLNFDGCIDGTFAEGHMTGTLVMQTGSSATIPDIGTVSSSGQINSAIDQTCKELPKK